MSQREEDKDHEDKADEVERDLDEMQQRSERLQGDIEGTRDDWESKQADEGVPGAVGATRRTRSPRTSPSPARATSPVTTPPTPSARARRTSPTPKTTTTRPTTTPSPATTSPTTTTRTTPTTTTPTNRRRRRRRRRRVRRRREVRRRQGRLPQGRLRRRRPRRRRQGPVRLRGRRGLRRTAGWVGRPGAAGRRRGPTSAASVDFVSLRLTNSTLELGSGSTGPPGMTFPVPSRSSPGQPRAPGLRRGYPAAVRRTAAGAVTTAR